MTYGTISNVIQYQDLLSRVFSVNLNRNFMIILPVPDQVSTAGK